MHRHASGHAVGLSVIRSSGEPESAWLPASFETEPGFLAYGITKTIIAVLILQLEEAGRLSIDEPIARWLPQIPQSKQISIRQLSNHTAGIPDYGPLPEYHASVRQSPSIPWTFATFAAHTFDKRLAFTPGHGWAYSNPGYMLLRKIAEEVAGASLAQLVSERIVGPIGLESMFVAETIDDVSSLAPAPSRALSADATVRDMRDLYHPGWVSHGVVAASPSDIARFLHCLFHYQLISKHSVDRMKELVSLSFNAESEERMRKPSYGLGLMADPESPWGPVWGHNGGGPGYTSSAFFAPELGDVSVCAMAAIEDEQFEAKTLVFEAFDFLASSR